ncbi:hypothetical protein [Actinoplanes siamensis]|uniref:hypothetical protein n=1 Tax=Actinoplanes siamensis TaxID=1223317 RepID=UPI00360B1833
MRVERDGAWRGADATLVRGADATLVRGADATLVRGADATLVRGADGTISPAAAAPGPLYRSRLTRSITRQTSVMMAAAR